MAFWNSNKIKSECRAHDLVYPFREDRVVHSAYELGVGQEAYITSKTDDTTRLEAGEKISIPAGQFGLLTTREVVRVPNNAIGFISIRARIKFQGLVNVSGFHVDPGFHGPLKFAVYNAGSKEITLDQDQRVFMLWFADLNEDTPDPYKGALTTQSIISSEDVDRMKGDVASPAELKKQLDEMEHEYEKRLQSVEITQKLVMGLAIAVGILLAGIMLRGGWFDRAIQLGYGARVTAGKAESTGVDPTTTATVDAVPTISLSTYIGWYVVGAGIIAGGCTIGAAYVIRKNLKEIAKSRRR